MAENKDGSNGVSWRMLGCPAAMILMVDHAIHLYPDALGGELSVAYFAALVTLMLLVALVLADEAKQIFTRDNLNSVCRRVIDVIFRIPRK